MKDFSKTNYHYLFFIVLFFFQLFIVNDYGFSHDEELSRLNGLVSYNYILEKFNFNTIYLHPDTPKLENYIDRTYGVIFELLLVIIEKALNLDNSKLIYLTRHYLTSFTFFIGCIFFYLTLRKFFSKKISLLGTLIFLSHPRIFAHSFYNSKDIVFLVFFCISNFFLINFFFKQNLKNIFFLSISISLAICVRPMAIIIPFLFIFFYIMQNLDKKNFKKIFLLIPFSFFTIFLTILLWPFLWDDPSRIFEVLKSMSKFEWIGEVFFNGKYYTAKYMPWYYAPIMILITTPIFQISLFVIGFLIISKTLFINLLDLNNSKENVWKNEIEFFLLYSLIIIFLPLFLIIEFNSTIYTGWRQIYFIYPSIIFVCIFGLDYIFKYKYLKKYILILITLSLSLNFFNSFKNHPYQYNFYNFFVKDKDLKNFEHDYWGVSNLDILKKIEDFSDEEYYYIYVFSVNPYHYSLNMISEKDKNKFKFVQNLQDADFILSNHYYQDYYYKEKDYLESKHPLYIEDFLNSKFDLVYEIKSNNVRINSIYKKNK
jgi:hypothetical protein